MDAFLFSTLAVAVAEIGDKTQILTLMLAARYRRPLVLCVAILIATVANHLLAALLGSWTAALLPAHWLPWIIAASFVAVALWTLIPDRLDQPVDKQHSTHSVLLICTVAFFVAEIGDKTQIATVVLAAKFDALFAVVVGTTLGMLLANLPVVWLGERYASRLPLKWTRALAAALFLILAVATLIAM